MIECVNCRASVADDAKFCAACGHKVERAAPEPVVSGSPGRSASRKLPIFAGVAAVVGAAVLFLEFGGRDGTLDGSGRPAATIVEKSPQIPPAPAAPASTSESITARPIAPPPIIAGPRSDKPPQVEARVPAVTVEKQDAQPRLPERPVAAAVANKQREQASIAAAPPVAAREQPRAIQTDKAQQPTRADPKLARQLNARGLTLSREGRHAEAAAQFRAARDANDADPEIRENLGYALLKAGRLDEAETALLAAIEIAPRRATALGSLGYVEAKRGRHDEGVKLMLAALRVSPDPQQTLATYTRQARTESDPKVRAMLAEVVSRAP